MTLLEQKSKLIMFVEVATREPSQSKRWFHYTAGRITASKFKAAVHTDLTLYATQKSSPGPQGGGVNMKKLLGMLTENKLQNTSTLQLEIEG